MFFLLYALVQIYRAENKHRTSPHHLNCVCSYSERWQQNQANLSPAISASYVTRAMLWLMSLTYKSVRHMLQHIPTTC